MQPRFGSIGVRLEQLAELRKIKGEWEGRAGKRFKWGDFLMMLVTLHQTTGSHFEPVQFDTVTMGQGDQAPDAGEPSEVSLDSTAFDALPITLGIEDQERIAELVAEKVEARLRRAP